MLMSAVAPSGDEPKEEISCRTNTVRCFLGDHGVFGNAVSKHACLFGRCEHDHRWGRLYSKLSVSGWKIHRLHTMSDKTLKGSGISRCGETPKEVPGKRGGTQKGWKQAVLLATAGHAVQSLQGDGSAFTTQLECA